MNLNGTTTSPDNSRAKQPVSLRVLLYLILVFVSLILLFYSTWQVRPIIVDPHDPLGLVSHLPPLYWVSLAILLLISVFAFLDRALSSDAVFILILIALGFFLFGLPVLAQENARDPSAYYPTSEVQHVLAAGHLDTTYTGTTGPVAYYSWPTTHFLSAAILKITGIDLGFIKYVPLFWMLALIFITYSLGKRLKLEPNRCFLVSFLVLSSFLIGFAGTYAPRSIAMMIFLLFSLLVLSPRRTTAEAIVTILTFMTLVLSHGFTAVAAISALIILSIYRKDPGIVPLCIVIFAAWYMYQAVGAMELGARQALSKPFFDILFLAKAERYQLASVIARSVNRYAQLSYLVLYFPLIITSAIMLIRRKITGERRKYVISLFCWAIGSGIMVMLNYGGEGPYRLYLYCLLPAVAITVLSFSSRKLLASLIPICTIIFLFANYSADAGYQQVRTSELKGTEFLALEVKPQHLGGGWFYGTDPALVFYYSPNLSGEVFNPTFHGPKSPQEVDPAILNPIRYIIISKQASDSIVYGWGEDPYANWPQTEVGKRADLLYNNGYFQIYDNNLYMQYR